MCHAWLLTGVPGSQTQVVMLVGYALGPLSTPSPKGYVSLCYKQKMAQTSLSDSPKVIPRTDVRAGIQAHTGIPPGGFLPCTSLLSVEAGASLQKPGPLPWLSPMGTTGNNL